MDATWLNLLGHDLIGLILLGLINEIWSHQAELQRFEQRWVRFVARQRRQQARLLSQGLPGLGHRPDCADCQGQTIAAVEPACPPLWVEPKRGRRRQIKPTWQFCPDEQCLYFCTGMFLAIDNHTAKGLAANWQSLAQSHRASSPGGYDVHAPA